MLTLLVRRLKLRYPLLTSNINANNDFVNIEKILFCRNTKLVIAEIQKGFMKQPKVFMDEALMASTAEGGSF